MNKNIDEAYMILLKAKQGIYEYTNKKIKNENWRPYYNGLIEKIDDIIVDYSITTKMSEDEIMSCLYEVGAYDESSIYYDLYCTMKKNI